MAVCNQWTGLGWTLTLDFDLTIATPVTFLFHNKTTMTNDCKNLTHVHLATLQNKTPTGKNKINACF